MSSLLRWLLRTRPVLGSLLAGCLLLSAVGAEVARGAEEKPAVASPPTEKAPATPVEPAVEKPQVAEAPAEPASSPPKPQAAEAPHAGANSDGKFTFNFRYQPWQEVLDWFADQAGLSLVLESPPPGTFNYHDSRSYTLAQALDVINSVLLTKGFTLVRNGHMLVLVNLEDGIPPNLVRDVQLENLDEHGDYEIIRVTFPVLNMSAEEAAKEVEPLLGPQGAVIVLPQSKRIQVTETGGRLRSIRAVINAVERPVDPAGGIREITLKYLSVDDALPYLRQLLGIPSEAFSTTDNQLTLGKDVTGYKLLVHGTPERVARAEQVVRLIDVPDAAKGISGAPQLEVYPITSADPQAVLSVLQTLLESDKSVKLAVDPITGHLVAFARPAQQATIAATVDQMQRDARQVAVIPLSTVDPQVAVLSITKLFGGLEKDKPDPSAPRVDADITTQSLLVRGTAGQVQQIKDLLAQMGETETEGGSRTKSNEHVRLLPLTGAQARSALQQIEQIWPTMRQNRIRVVLPSQTIQTYRPSDETGNTQDKEQAPDRPPVEADSPEPSAMVPLDRSNFHLAQWLRYVDDQVTSTGENRPGAPIVVAPGPGGVLVASDDLEALDDFEQLLSTVAERNTSASRDYAVFYLKYAKATTVSEVLSAIFGGGSKGGGLVNDMAGAALGDLGGGLMGNLLLGGGGGGSGGGFSSGSVDIVPDVRLNALVVRAKPADLDTVEQLLRVLDQRVGPEDVEADLRPRLIPVYNTQASEIASVVQQIYSDRMASGGPQVMSPQDMLKMIRGGNNVDQQTQKMSFGIDERSNSLVVRAPDPLFEEVKSLVAQLDEIDTDSPEITRVVSLKHTNSSAVQRALVSVLGEQAKTSTTTSVGSQRPPFAQGQGGGNDEQRDRERQQRRAMWRNMEMFREMQRMNERMGGGGGGGDRGRGGDDGRGRGGPGGGGPGGGGRPGGFPGGGGGGRGN
ncbi:MAG: secretin N-terminal domain-containing protein [Pirellulales bacterium]